jgi:hypothetical protein
LGANNRPDYVISFFLVRLALHGADSALNHQVLDQVPKRRPARRLSQIQNRPPADPPGTNPARALSSPAVASAGPVMTASFANPIPGFIIASIDRRLADQAAG